MLTRRYLSSTKNLNDILAKIVDGVAPEKFNSEHLKSIGFASSGDRAVVPLLKDLGFLSADGAPLPRYLNYRDRSRSKAVMAEALRDTYSDLFHVREFPSRNDRSAIEGVFRSRLNSTEKIAKLQAMTFFALLDNADLQVMGAGTSIPDSIKRPEPEENISADTPEDQDSRPPVRREINAELHYTIQVHLPATKDIEVFNAIFRSLKANLLQ